MHGSNAPAASITSTEGEKPWIQTKDLWTLLFTFPAFAIAVWISHTFLHVTLDRPLIATCAIFTFGLGVAKLCHGRAVFLVVSIISLARPRVESGGVLLTNWSTAWPVVLISLFLYLLAAFLGDDAAKWRSKRAATSE